MNPQIFLRGWMSEKLCWKATLCKYLHLKIIKWFLTNQRDVALIVISRVLLIMWFDEILFKQYIILNFKAYLVVFCSLAKVFNSSESKTALFCAKRRQKAPQIFFPKSATILVKGATFWDIWIWTKQQQNLVKSEQESEQNTTR